MRSWHCLATAGFVGLVIAACGGSSSDDSGVGSGANSPLAFHGSQSPFPGFKYDTGAQPADSPVTVDLALSVAGSITADAAATQGGSNTTPTVAAVPNSGKLVMDVHFKLGGTLHAAITGVPSYDGAIPGIENIDIAFGGNVAFDPFLIGKDAPLTAKIPQTKLPSIPLPGGIPGDLEITIMDGSTMTSTFHGVCAGVSNNKATYTATTTSTASVILQAAVVIHVPIVGDKTITIPSFTVNVPAVTQPMDLGTFDAPGGGAAPTGDSLADPSGCTSRADGGANGGSSDGGSSTGGGNDNGSNDGSTGTGGSSDGSTGGDGGSCTPMTPAASFTYRPPTGQHQNLCTTTAIDAFVTACVDDAATEATCTSFKTSNATCHACLVSDISAPNWGPIVNSKGGGFPNVGGCIALVDPSNTGCARSEENEDLCVDSACAACSDTSGYSSCGNTVVGTTCQSDVSTAQLCEQSISDAGMNTCLGNGTQSNDDFYRAYATLFCGP